MQIYEQLKSALKSEIIKNNISGEKVTISCKALSPTEAIGSPEHNDYPIIKGKEVMVEAHFNGAKGQAFADEFENAEYSTNGLLSMELDSNAKRASFISGFNAIFRNLGLCDKTVHCKDKEPVICSDNLPEIIKQGQKVLIVGFQPRFLEKLSSYCEVRIVDMDPANIGKTKFGVLVEESQKTDEAIEWCDIIFATGSTLVNGTITRFLKQNKPVIFYGVTISAAAKILNLNQYCYCGR